MDHKDWFGDISADEFIKGFMDAMFMANGIDPATVPERIQKEKEGIFIPDKVAVSKVRTIYHHMKAAFSGTKAIVFVAQAHILSGICRSMHFYHAEQ